MYKRKMIGCVLVALVVISGANIATGVSHAGGPYQECCGPTLTNNCSNVSGTNVAECLWGIWGTCTTTPRATGVCITMAGLYCPHWASCGGTCSRSSWVSCSVWDYSSC
jgi:hypothetical protein